MKTSSEMNRRQLFKGIAAAALLPCLPKVLVPEVGVAAQKVMMLSPFAPGRSDSLTRMVVALMESEQMGRVVAALSRMEGFHREMLSGAQAGETSGHFLTRLFGEGEWSDLVSPIEEVELEFVREDGRCKRLEQYTTIAVGETDAVDQYELAG
jgi:hypothetical protein